MNFQRLQTLAGCHWQQDVNMAQHTTFKAGGKAAALCDVHSVAALSALLKQLSHTQIPWRVLGKGSNLLVSEKGFPGLLIRLNGDFKTLTLPQKKETPIDTQTIHLCINAGCSSAKLVNQCTQQGIGGLTFMAGLPGTLGGAIRMNAGAWGQDIGQVLETVSFIDEKGESHTLPAKALSLAYRTFKLPAQFSSRFIITQAILRLYSADPKALTTTGQHYRQNRRQKQPQGVASAGSFFRNPPNDSAGRLIEAAGLKGKQQGHAQISPQHANFIVNTGKATARDICRLAQEAEKQVYKHSGIRLEPEVHIL